MQRHGSNTNSLCHKPFLFRFPVWVCLILEEYTTSVTWLNLTNYFSWRRFSQFFWLFLVLLPPSRAWIVPSHLCFQSQLENLWHTWQCWSCHSVNAMLYLMLGSHSSVCQGEVGPSGLLSVFLLLSAPETSSESWQIMVLTQTKCRPK